MAATWFPLEGWTLDVPNPGNGEIEVEGLWYDDFDAEIIGSEWRASFAGYALTDFLTKVTTCALGEHESDGLTPAARALAIRGEQPFDSQPMTQSVARALLPALQSAVLLAAAGTDRHDRLYDDDGGYPRAPLCVNCNEGTGFTTPGVLASPWCDKFGHSPFAAGVDTRWQDAQASHARDRDRYDRKREQQREQERAVVR